MTTWGVVATIKARPKEVLSFVAYHLEQGADHLFIFLDNENPVAEAALRADDRVTVTRTHDQYWRDRQRKRPAKHQVRQTVNATFAYENAGHLDWLIHIDVDEYLCPARTIHQTLSEIASDVVCARVHPAEALATDGIDGLDPKATYCKAWMPADFKRRDLEAQIYPNFGGYIRGGFVSHFVGKIFVRTGQKDLIFRIHRGTVHGDEIAPQIALKDIELCHRHITGWESWRKVMDYRMSKGSYRSELKPTRPADVGGMSLHDLFTFLHTQGGEASLRAFFEEVCLARPELLKTLQSHDLLRVYYLGLDAARRKHFPDWRRNVAK
ncbi:Glycosyl transferase family 2 [Shimia gijangensis]|uniref:Glycosyl transferase family 2 n=1 Tax=Shimia gijangensis TaxID=1470563 RepID=A0A1M6L6V1_9RHOB|nr:glycosyltransferase family 2 protein [Shimia gijangensis]SHJ66854.1 Glycosyl transferase family 2 [Shimia gijangensis]